MFKKTKNKSELYGICRCVPHLDAVCIHVTQLRDGVFGVDGDDDLRSSLVPVKPTRRHFLTLQRYSTI